MPVTNLMATTFPVTAAASNCCPFDWLSRRRPFKAPNRDPTGKERSGSLMATGIAHGTLTFAPFSVYSPTASR